MSFHSRILQAVIMQKIAILYDAGQAALSTFDLDEVLEQIPKIVHEYFHLENVRILLLDKASGELVVKSQIGWTSGTENLRLPLGKGLTGIAAKERRPIYSPDVERDPRYLASTIHARSQLAVPLLAGEEVIGVLDCQSEELNHFDSETIDLLTLFSTQAAMALQNARLYSLERRRSEQLEAINTIAQQMTVVLELKELLGKVCALIATSFKIEHVSIFLKEGEELVLSGQQGKLGLAADTRLPAQAGLWGRALNSGKTAIDHNVGAAGDYVSFEQGNRSRMSIPLISFGQSLGVLVLDSTQPNAFQATEQRTLESVADICATAIQNAWHVERVRQLAYIDGLTGIFNRRFFELRIAEEIERAKRFNTKLAVIMIDIDQFKRLNDEFGHLLGDEVLRQVSSIFSQHLRRIDVVCRFGGEEFSVLLPQTSPEQALQVAEKLRRMVESWQFPGVPRPVTISAGASTFPEHGMSRDELVKAADRGLYAAKQSGRNKVLLAPSGKKTLARKTAPVRRRRPGVLGN